MECALLLLSPAKVVEFVKSKCRLSSSTHFYLKQTPNSDLGFPTVATTIYGRWRGRKGWRLRELPEIKTPGLLVTFSVRRLQQDLVPLPHWHHPRSGICCKVARLLLGMAASLLTMSAGAHSRFSYGEDHRDSKFSQQIDRDDLEKSGEVEKRSSLLCCTFRHTSSKQYSCRKGINQNRVVLI